MEQFQAWIQDLDGAAGQSIAFELVPHQSYVTYLTAAQAEDIKQLDLIACIWEHVPVDQLTPDAF